MLRFERLDDRNILLVTAEGPLGQADFDAFAEQFETDGAGHERPTRLMIRADSFPGWDSFEAFVAHLKFVSEHHRQVERIAIVTDSQILKLMPHLAGLLVHPRIKQFDLGQTDEAITWLDTGLETTATG